MMWCVYTCGLYLCFFFFKQKTAYEMRISDWSSDVCSSDLTELALGNGHQLAPAVATGRAVVQFHDAPGRSALRQQRRHGLREILHEQHREAPAAGRPQHQAAGELAEQRQRRAVARPVEIGRAHV